MLLDIFVMTVLLAEGSLSQSSRKRKHSHGGQTCAEPDTYLGGVLPETPTANIREEAYRTTAEGLIDLCGPEGQVWYNSL